MGYYYFIYVNNTRKSDYYSFADDLRKMIGNSRTNDSVGMRFSNFAYLDPSSNSGFANGYKKCVPIWNECINKDRTPKDSFINLFMSFIKKYGNNKSIYNSFLKEYKNYKF